MRSKAELIEELRTMLREVFQLRNDGATYQRLARAHGYADGYMRALLESGLATKTELLALVSEERANVSGPATRAQMRADEADEIIAA